MSEKELTTKQKENQCPKCGFKIKKDKRKERLIKIRQVLMDKIIDIDKELGLITVGDFVRTTKEAKKFIYIYAEGEVVDMVGEVCTIKTTVQEVYQGRKKEGQFLNLSRGWLEVTDSKRWAKREN